MSDQVFQLELLTTQTKELHIDDGYRHLSLADVQFLAYIVRHPDCQLTTFVDWMASTCL